jgi:hypothetical protein
MTLPKDLLPSISRQMPQHSRLAKKEKNEIRQNKYKTNERDRTSGVFYWSIGTAV